MEGSNRTIDEVIEEYEHSTVDLKLPCDPMLNTDFSSEICQFTIDLFTACKDCYLRLNREEMIENNPDFDEEDGYDEWFELEWSYYGRIYCNFELITLNENQVNDLINEYHIPLIKLITEKRAQYIVIKPSFITDLRELEDFTTGLDENPYELKITEEEYEKLVIE